MSSVGKSVSLSIKQINITYGVDDTFQIRNGCASVLNTHSFKEKTLSSSVNSRNKYFSVSATKKLSILFFQLCEVLVLNTLINPA